MGGLRPLSPQPAGAERRGEGQVRTHMVGLVGPLGAPAIFSPAARGAGAETKPKKPRDTVPTHGAARGDRALLAVKRLGLGGRRTLAAAERL